MEVGLLVVAKPTFVAEFAAVREEVLARGVTWESDPFAGFVLRFALFSFT